MCSFLFSFHFKKKKKIIIQLLHQVREEGLNQGFPYKGNRTIQDF